MSTTEMKQRIGKVSPRVRTTFVGAYYLLTLVTCAFIFFIRGGQAFAVHFITGFFFIGITAFFYGVSKPEKK